MDKKASFFRACRRVREHQHEHSPTEPPSNEVKPGLLFLISHFSDACEDLRGLLLVAALCGALSPERIPARHAGFAV
jgi:hypothetical protein